MGKVATSPAVSGPYQSGGQNQKWPTSGVATSPLPYRGSPPLQSGGQNQNWPTSGRNGYLTPAVSGALQRGAESELAHKWAKWLPHPCRIASERGAAGGIRSGPQVGESGYLTPAVSGIPTASEVAHKWAKWATSPLPYRGSPPLQSGGQNQKWPTSGQSGYLTPAVSGIPTAWERGAESEVAHKWAKWLPHPCRIGDPHRFRAGGRIRIAYRGSPPLQSGRQNQKWPTTGRNGYLTPAVSGIPNARGAESVSGIPTALPRIRTGPQVGKVATSPLPYRGSPPLQSGGQNQKWPTSGQSGYLTPAVSGIPTASERGAESELAHKWAKWLPHPCRIGDPHRFRAGGKIRSGPQVGEMATSPLPYRGSPPLQSGGQNQKWPTSGRNGYLTPAVSRIPSFRAARQNQKWPTSGQSGYLTPAVESEVAHKWAKVATSPLPYQGSPPLQERGAESEVAHKWAKWLPHPCRIRDPHRFTAGGRIRSGPQVGKVATSPLPYRGSPPLHSREESEVAHKWAKWLPHPCRIGDPHRFRAGGRIRSGPQVGEIATSPLPYPGSPPLHSGGQNQKWPTSGQSGYLTPAVSGIPTA